MHWVFAGLEELTGYFPKPVSLARAEGEEWRWFWGERRWGKDNNSGLFFCRVTSLFSPLPGAHFLSLSFTPCSWTKEVVLCIQRFWSLVCYESMALGKSMMIPVYTEGILVQSHRLYAQLPQRCMVQSQSWLVFGGLFQSSETQCILLGSRPVFTFCLELWCIVISVFYFMSPRESSKLFLV